MSSTCPFLSLLPPPTRFFFFWFFSMQFLPKALDEVDLPVVPKADQMYSCKLYVRGVIAGSCCIPWIWAHKHVRYLHRSSILLMWFAGWDSFFAFTDKRSGQNVRAWSSKSIWRWTRFLYQHNLPSNIVNFRLIILFFFIFFFFPRFSGILNIWDSNFSWQINLKIPLLQRMKCCFKTSCLMKASIFPIFFSASVDDRGKVRWGVSVVVTLPNFHHLFFFFFFVGYRLLLLISNML